MSDFIADNFGLLEWILFLELVVLITATFFYTAAKLITGKNRDDPMVRFYHVFWRAFMADVTPMGVMDAQQAEAIARSKGVIMVGDLEPEQLAKMDAPDLGELTQDDLRGNPVRTAVEVPESKPASPTRGKPEQPAPPADATLDVRIVGRSPADQVAGHDGRTMVLNVRADVEDGQANAVATELASKALGIPIYRIVLLRGHYKADKAFKIIGIDQAALNAKVSQL